MGSNATPREEALASGRPPPQPQVSGSAGGGSDGSGHSRSDSFTMVDGRTSGPTSASSSGFSNVSYPTGSLRHPTGTPDPASAISSVYSTDMGGVSMEREGSNHVLPDLEKLSLEKGRDLDVEDLDDDGWKAASEQKQIVEIGSLGEGAGGAVTLCRLKKGKTQFALKVFILIELRVCACIGFWLTKDTRRSSLLIQIQTSRNKSNASLPSIRSAPASISANTTANSTILAVPSASRWSIAKEAPLTVYTEK